MMHKMEQVHSEVINIVEFGWARYISLTHTIFGIAIFFIVY
jgi:hypothetical protein